MIDIIDESTYEGSQATFAAAFTDDAGAALTPDSIHWTLTDTAGAVINDRQAEAVETPAASVDIELDGADLQILAAEEGLRVTRELTIEAWKDDRPLNTSIRFYVTRLVGRQSVAAPVTP